MRKRRSAKQRANDRRLGRMAKSRHSKTVKRKTSSRSSMARRRKSSTRTRYVTRARRAVSRRSGGKILSTLKPVASGIGGGILVETVANRIGMGQYGNIAYYAGAYGFGGMKGVIGKLAFDVLSGRGIGFGVGGQQQGVLSV